MSDFHKGIENNNNLALIVLMHICVLHTYIYTFLISLRVTRQ